MSIGLDALPALLAALSESVARAASVATSEDASRATTQRAIDAHLSAIHSVGAEETGTPCVAAEAYLGTTLFRLEESVELEIAGNDGGQTISFVSGTALSAMVAAIGTVVRTTGVSASQALEERTRVELRSVDPGSDQFVSVRQVSPGDGAPIIFATEHDERARFEHKDFGEDGPAGDLDCDMRVGMSDLTALLRAWGICEGCPEDVNDDGVVNVLDVVFVLERWSG